MRNQAPLALSDRSEPEPDVSVVAGRRDDFLQHPTHALLVVEVADASLTFDRTRKAALYAESGVPEYWIVNLVDRQVEVHREPRSDKDAETASVYSKVTIHREGDTIAPLGCPDASIPVSDVLP